MQLDQEIISTPKPSQRSESAPLTQRREEVDAVSSAIFDVAIIGGGINGACLYHELCARGYRAILVDKGDFAGGTSQTSAMWIWGGLRYLARAELATVIRLSASRDLMVRTLAHAITPQTFRLLAGPQRPGGAERGLLAGLYLYWMLGGFRRRLPHRESNFPERELLGNSASRLALCYEEARVRPSDARFVLSWILPHRNPDRPALNYCPLGGGRWDAARKQWRLELTDLILYRQFEARVRCVVNAAGCWTDTINACFGRASPWQHLFGRGVFIGIRRDPRHHSPLIMRMENHDAMSLIPWGPVSLWGPADSLVASPEEGFEPSFRDVPHLIDQLNRHLARPLTPESIVSMRRGVRPLAVARSRADTRAPIEHLSRRSAIYRDPELPWISVYGGKLTYCLALAHSVAARVAEIVEPSASDRSLPMYAPAPQTETFPGLAAPVLSARWCAKHELCWTLEDYLRRRTNIAQWVARGGLGERMQNRHRINEIAGQIGGFRGQDTQSMASAYAGGADQEIA